jgi:hypothetical protein
MSSTVDLYWLPLGAGGHSVAWNGRVYEALAARWSGRPGRALYHSALVVTLHEVRHAIEMGPVWNVAAADRGVVCEGPVGSRVLGHLRLFRYEVRCWREGTIPDADSAVGSPVRLAADPAVAAAVLDAVRRVPPLTWGRDELRSGEMWNSNSVVAWTLATAGIEVTAVRPPVGGRAPGWSAGLALAGRQAEVLSRTTRS